jgi:cytochrome c peroxidase
LLTEPGWNMHMPQEMCVDAFQANRSPDQRYRTAPLAGLFAHQTGGYYHDGRLATLDSVVDHYNQCKSLGLTNEEKKDLIQYLLSI